MTEEIQGVQPAQDTPAAVQPVRDTALADYKSADTAEQRIAVMHKLGLLEDPKHQARAEEQQPHSAGETEATPAPDGETPQEEQPADRVEEQPKPYTAEEIRATDFDKLDYKRLPPELVPFYNSMRASQTKNSQEMAQQRKFLKELAAELQKSPAAAPPPTPEQRFTQRHNALKGAVAQAFNIRPADLGDDMNLWPPALRLAYDDFNQYVHRVEERRENQRQETARQQKQVASFTAAVETELRAADNEAYEYAMAKIKGGEVLEKDKRSIIGALVQGDRKTLAQYFEKFRKEFHQESERPKPKDKKTPAPPSLETSGQGTTQSRPVPKVAEYRSADQARRVELMKAWGLLE
ncbi:MAG: hypothetical protein P4N59_25650 [Negativicutes bacterium]|nr:hypothetical protein [Negativicutes bacterium]